MAKIKEMLYPVLQRLRYLPFLIFYKIFCAGGIKDNKVLMFSSVRGKLGGNLLQIKNYIDKNNLPYELAVYTSENMPHDFKLAKEAASSHYILIDDYEPKAYVLKLRKKQELVQVWHGLGAFKKFGYSRESAVKTSLTHKNYTKTIVSSPAVISAYKEAFAMDEKGILPLGIPRTDLLFDDKYIESTKKRLMKNNPQLKGKKVCVFAPTFRGENVNSAFYPSDFFNPQVLADSLGDDWVVVTKYHPFIKNAEIYNSKNVVDMSNEREMNDVLLIADVLVTDYSSVIFENAILGKPLVLYVPDLDQYTDTRGFYYDYNMYSYGEMVQDFSELAEVVKVAKNDEEKLKRFREMFTCCCDGHSTERFVNEILKV